MNDSGMQNEAERIFVKLCEHLGYMKSAPTTPQPSPDFLNDSSIGVHVMAIIANPFIE